MKLNRRRFLTISAAAAVSSPVVAGDLQHIRFQALGADCQVTLPGARQSADQAVAAIRMELERIEQAFSLYRPDSQLMRLNREGFLRNPDPVFLDGLTKARDLSAATGGAYDPTVQTLWQANATGTPAGPVNWRDTRIEGVSVRFAQTGMSATLNGIAQGIATDRAVAVLKAHGYRDVLANLGEFAALGQHPDERDWQIGVQNPVTNDIATTLTPTPGAPAIATSEPLATMIAGQSHIFDPLGRPGQRWRSVTVQATSATLADGLSTAVAASPMKNAKALLQANHIQMAVLIDATGETHIHRL